VDLKGWDQRYRTELAAGMARAAAPAPVGARSIWHAAAAGMRCGSRNTAGR